jgi:hypothetical protein
VVDAERQRWLQTLEAACERVLANGLNPDDLQHADLREDVERLLAQIRSELRGGQ